MNILVTGANGYLGYQTVVALMASQSVKNVVALVRNADKYRNNPANLFPAQVKIIDVNELLKGSFDINSIDVLCHLASSRNTNNPQDIASSLQLTNTLMNIVIQAKVKLVLNASTQAVYGVQPPLWKESDEVAPVTTYGEAKWASELIVQNIQIMNPMAKAISLRFSKLIGVSNNFKFADELPHIFAKNILMQESVILQNGGKQLYDLIDVRDAASVIVKIVETYPCSLPQTINVGSGTQISSLQIAQLVSNIASKKYGKTLNFRVEENFQGQYRDFGMSTLLLQESLQYTPQYTIERSIENILDFVKNALKL